MSSLYEIADEIAAILNGEDGEIPLDAVAMLDELEGSLEEKLERCVKAIRSYEASKQAKRLEAAFLQDSARRDERRIEWLKGYVMDCLQKIGQTKAQAGIFKVAIVRNPHPTVEYEGDVLDLPAHLRVAKWSVDKTAILLAAREDKPVPDGVTITTGSHLRIS